MTMRTIDVEKLSGLMRQLGLKGYQLLGPTRRDGAIVYDEIEGVDDLPRGWGDVQEAGVYRLRRRDDDALFGFAVGPHSWKRVLFPPEERLWQARREPNQGFEVIAEDAPPPRFAFIGVRACDLEAIAIQDQVFLGEPVAQPSYARRRAESFIIVVQCGEPSGTCFCASMESGPRAVSGFDLAMTEIVEDDNHRFVAEAGSERGAELLAEVSAPPTTEEDLRAAKAVVASAARRMGRSMETSGIQELLYANLEHPRWDEVAERCLTCANCTLVCPTCFCATIEDTTDLTGDRAERWRRWDSCFTLAHSYLHGGSVRATPKARYRQWVTHKLATWIDQFGTSGCVGCGRCITWCPVGIDITEEVRAIRESGPLRAEEAT